MRRIKLTFDQADATIYVKGFTTYTFKHAKNMEKL